MRPFNPGGKNRPERAATRKEPAYPVRARALNLLAQWSPSGPTVADALTVVASRDPNADLREVARRALAK